jgi:hypothetical protein
MLVSSIALSYGIAFSHHVGLEQSYNEVHPYVSATVSEKFSLTAYINSLDGLSVAAGYKINVTDNTSLTLGGVTGYKLPNTPIAPYFKLDYRLSDNVDLSLMPAYEQNENEDKIGTVVAVTFKF